MAYTRFGDFLRQDVGERGEKQGKSEQKCDRADDGAEKRERRPRRTAGRDLLLGGAVIVHHDRADTPGARGETSSGEQRLEGLPPLGVADRAPEELLEYPKRDLILVCDEADAREYRDGV